MASFRSFANTSLRGGGGSESVDSAAEGREGVGARAAAALPLVLPSTLRQGAA